MAYDRPPTLNIAPTTMHTEENTAAMETKNTEPSRRTDPPSRQFSYKPLDLSLHPNAFRLIRILPERIDGLIQVEIQQMPMKEVENNTAAIDQTLEPRSRELGTVYRCLSYTWGESPAEHQILLNGDTFCVRKNLFEFLEIAVRLLSYDLLWVDAICIDQTNVTERGHQVKRMDIIYKGAVQVLIWLGNSSSVVDAADHIELHRSKRKCSRSTITQFKDMMQHPYWWRAWITQEIVLAREVQIVHASGTVSWHSLLDTMDLRKHRGPPNLRVWRLYICQHRYSGFWPTLYSRDLTACADPRDRVYSLLGVTKGTESFSVDYEEDIADLFWRTAEYFHGWRSPSHISLLQHALHVSVAQLIASLEHRPDMSITIPVYHAYLRRPRLSRLRRKIECVNDAHQIPATSQHEVLLCTTSGREDPKEWGHTHILVFRTSTPISGLGFTFVERSYANYDKKYKNLQDMKLGDYMLQRRYSQNEAHAKGEWVDILVWADFVAMLKTRSGDELSGEWRLRAPATYVIPHLQPISTDGDGP